MEISAQLINDINKIDWDFTGALSQYSVHRFHWYPASFIPQIPAYLIELFSNPGDLVYDPFCGSGTTLVEAVRLGRRAIGSDINTVATFITQAKIKFFEPAALETQCNQFIHQVEVEQQTTGLTGQDSLLVYEPTPNLKALETEYAVLEPWYDPQTFQEMLLIWNLIGKQHAPFRNLLIVTFSQLAKRVCSQRKHWGYVADNMIPVEKHYFNAVKIFSSCLRDFVNELIRFLEFPSVKGANISELNRRAYAIQADLSKSSVVKPNTVNLIVTSPPYVSVTDYTTSQRLSMYWLKQDINALKRAEIGARWKRNRSTAFVDYSHEIEACFSNIFPTLKQSGFFCMVIGLSDRHNKGLAIVEHLEDYTISAGFKKCAEFVRTPSRQRVMDRGANIKQEAILVFQKC